MIERIIISGYRCFESLDFEPNQGLNIVVGDNESGKSTLLEAISLVLTGRSNGRWLGEELNPYWFHRPNVTSFFQGSPTPALAPEFFIELYFSDSHDPLQAMRGVNNSLKEDVPGVLVKAAPNSEYDAEFRAYLASGPPSVIPVEFYAIEWRDFALDSFRRRPKALATAFIDSRTVRSTTGIDFYTREMLSGHLDDKERTEVSIAHRKARQDITDNTLAAINQRIANENAALHPSLGLQMDQSSRASWESAVVPQVEDVPFAMAGQGQQAAIKIALAMSRSVDVANFVLIEEPENHLSHTRLGRLIGSIEALAGEDQQLFITTHRSFVLNSLGIDALRLLGKGGVSKIGDLDDETVDFFRKLPGYDTLRLVLAEKIVLVEGPSDALIFERCFRDATGSHPIEQGIDVVSMNGLTLKRALAMCKALDRQAAVIRDNDGNKPEDLIDDLGDLLSPSDRQVFISAPDDGSTLEPQLINANDEQRLREVLRVPDRSTVEAWMTRNKTEAALRIHDAEESIVYPQYIQNAVAFVR